MKTSTRLTLLSFAAALMLVSASNAANAQVATGGSFAITQSVIAAGGGDSTGSNAATGGTYSLSGTIGQAIAGTRSTSAPFSAIGGFWTAELSPTAAAVSIAGRVLTPEGRALKGAVVTLADAGGNVQTAMTGLRGSYKFNEVRTGETYIITVASKRYRFAPQVITVGEELEGFDLTAQ